MIMETEVLSKEQFKTLSRVRQQQYAEKLILKLIEEAKQGGLTQQEIHKKTPFSISTISKYVDVLSAKRQIYKVTRGNLTILFPNGIPLHEITHEDIPIGKKMYSVSLIQNGYGKQIYIQEFETDDIGMKHLAGGIVIPAEAGKTVSNTIRKVAEDNAKLHD